MSSSLPSSDVLYEAHDFPIFQNRMYATATEARACPKGDIRLVQDSQMGIVCNQAFRPELMQYDANYQNEQAVSAVFREHLESVAKIIERTMGRRAIIEVGCGKGYFLEMLVSKGVQVTGFDPTYEGQSPHVAKRYFDVTVKVHAGGIVLRHVLEHIQDPVRFLESLRDANGGAGLIYIEVPCFDWINQHRAWFDIFYEHVNYFRLADFQRMFGRIEEAGHLFGGQYLYVVADLASLAAPTDAPCDQIRLTPDFMRSLMASSQQPAASSQQPAASSQQPAASSQQPAASSQQPAASSQQPAAKQRFGAAHPKESFLLYCANASESRSIL